MNSKWDLPDVVCDFYIAMDVTCSTSSILNLVAISIDRYFNIEYVIIAIIICIVLYIYYCITHPVKVLYIGNRGHSYVYIHYITLCLQFVYLDFRIITYIYRLYYKFDLYREVSWRVCVLYCCGRRSLC